MKVMCKAALLQVQQGLTLPVDVEALHFIVLPSFFKFTLETLVIFMQVIDLVESAVIYMGSNG